jgi:hypothetical protein
MSSTNSTIATESARRCAVCQTGRRRKEFALVETAEGESVLMCPACRKRHEASAATSSPAPAAPQKAERPAASSKPERSAKPERSPRPERSSKPERSATPAAAAPGEPQAAKSAAPDGEDRLKRALRELPAGEHAVGQIAKAAGLNQEKTLRRLHQLHDAGEIQRAGNRWSNRPPSTDLDEAMDRLREQTSNLRIVSSSR